MNINWDKVWDNTMFALNVAFMVVTGMIIIPLSALFTIVWPWWEKKEGIAKYLHGIWVLPIAGFLFIAAPWWNNYKVY